MRKVLEKDVIGETWADSEAYANLAWLCDGLSSRAAGSEGERRAAEFLRDKLEEYGLERVELEPFPYLCWERTGDGELEVTGPAIHRFPALTLPYSASGEAAGELFVLEEATAEYFDRRAPDMKGKVVLARPIPPTGSQATRRIHRPEIFARAVAAGAAGFLWMNTRPGQLPVTGTLRFNQDDPIPGAGVSRETGERLLRLAADGPVSVVMKTRSSVRSATSWNVVGDIVGEKADGPEVVVGAHYDSHDVGQGALDNGGGVAAVLEAARALSRHRRRLSGRVRVVFFGQEEMGLIGSLAYVRRHRAELDRIRFMLNVDGVGFDASKKVLSLQAQDGLRPLFQKVFADIGVNGRVESNVSIYWDHLGFLLAGVPCGSLSNMDVGRTLGRFGHTVADTLDKMSRQDLHLSATAVSGMLLRVLQTPAADWRGQRRDADAVRRLLARDGWLDTMDRTDFRPDIGGGWDLGTQETSKEAQT